MKNTNLLLITMAAPLGETLFGYDTGVIMESNSTSASILTRFDNEGMGCGQHTLAGCFFGTLFAGFVSKQEDEIR